MRGLIRISKHIAFSVNQQNLRKKSLSTANFLYSLILLRELSCKIADWDLIISLVLN